MARLPRSLLQELGQVTVTWAEIEQHLILHASAMTAQDTGGDPITDLRSDFKRLRELWWKEVVRRFPADDVNRVFQPLNMRLAEASKSRGDLFHGTWARAGRGSYHWQAWEQRTSLETKEATLTLSELRAFNRGLDELLRDLIAAST